MLRKYSFLFEEYFFLKQNMNDVELSVEKCRSTEVLFQPSIVGSKQMGLSEVLNETFKKIDDPELIGELMKNILITGGNFGFRGATRRISKEIRMISEPNSEMRIILSENPDLDGWNGASKFCMQENFWNSQSCLNKEDYEEKGIVFNHRCSN